MITSPAYSVKTAIPRLPLPPVVHPHQICIAARDVSLWYGGFQALNQVSVQIRNGAVTGLIGPSGCGKTTLLRSFNRINELHGRVVTRGEISIFGKNIYDADVVPSELRRTVGIVFQRPNPLPISIFDNIAFGPRSHATRGSLKRAELEAIVEKALREVLLWDELKDRLRQRATLLSLEQQQKLCIARLLPLQPRILLMDEPCSALDAAGTARVEELIDNLRGRFTVVVVTHNMAQARRISEECIYMLMGRIIEHGPTGQIFTDPKHDETRMYVTGRFG